MGRKKRPLELAELVALGLPDSEAALEALSIPEASALPKASVRELREAAEHFGSLAVRLSREDHGDGDVFWRAVRAVGAYFAFSLYRLALKGRPATALEVLRDVEDELTAEKADASSIESHLQQTQVEEVFGSFTFCASKLLFAADIDEMEIQLGQLTEKYDADLTAISALETFHEEAEGIDAEPLEVADDLLSRSFAFRRL
ncbi:MAG TPA: hypothetical protein VF030_08600, partial [Solirubrobacterales bacterium]